MKNEEWRDVVGYEGSYEVSNFSNVRSLNRLVHTVEGKIYRYKGKTLTQSPTKGGYQTVSLHLKNILKPAYVHRLVAEAFVDNPENKPEINHKNSIRSDNTPENLEWVTRSENCRHSHTKGFAKKGSAHSNSKLTESQVLEIRSMTNMTNRKLSEMFGVSHSIISDIILRKRWKHV